MEASVWTVGAWVSVQSRVRETCPRCTLSAPFARGSVVSTVWAREVKDREKKRTCPEDSAADLHGFVRSCDSARRSIAVQVDPEVLDHPATAKFERGRSAAAQRSIPREASLPDGHSAASNEEEKGHQCLRRTLKKEMKKYNDEELTSSSTPSQPCPPNTPSPRAGAAPGPSESASAHPSQSPQTAASSPAR